MTLEAVLEQIPVKARKDMRGLWRTRGGAVVRVLWWHAPRRCWAGKVLEGVMIPGCSWDAEGKHRERDYDLAERFSGRQQEMKFGLDDLGPTKTEGLEGMEHKPINNSNLQSTAHDPATGKMQVRFITGGLYEWDGVSSEQHTALRYAASPGGHLRRLFPKGREVS